MAAPMKMKSDHDGTEDEATGASSGAALLQPLSLLGDQTALNEGPKENLLQCLFCEENINVSSERDEYLRHLLMQHQLLVANGQQIPDFPKYIEYWRNKFSTRPLEEFCFVMKTNTKEIDEGNSEFYHMLCDALPEDKEIRIKLQKDRLAEALTQLQRERQDEEFERDCLFCRHNFNCSVEIFNHLANEHGLHIGHPDNLVYKAELLDLLEHKLKSLQCLYCEKTFKDRHVLKEHMRKKLHKKINPSNNTYDRFYIINYLEFGKNWEDIQSEEDSYINTALQDDWADWMEEESGQQRAAAVCLFCKESAQAETIIEHMKDKHKFDIHQIKKDHHMNFYQQVKLVNYIRRQMYLKCCHYCEETFSTLEDLGHHLIDTEHTSVFPDTKLWDQPEYFFPTYEDDSLLSALEDIDEESKSTSNPSKLISVAEGSVVIAESEMTLEEVMERKEKVMQELNSR